jgi:hypothetical protein
MKTLALLIGVRQVKAGAWSDVVYVPARAAIVVPAHAFSEPGF